MRRTDFLDVELDLDTKTFAPFHKPNHRIQYINARSNHPKAVVNSLPKAINDRLVKRSSNETVFDGSKGIYQRALKEAGYTTKLKYQVDQEYGSGGKRKRNVTWFNPPYCASVKTNIAREYIDLVKKHFDKRNPLRKIFNKSSMRVSYCCMGNIGSIIKAHNAKVLRKDDKNTDAPCDCRRKEECPFKNKGVSCQATSLVYRAEVKTKNSTKFYIGLSEPPFKLRYRNHTSSFDLERTLNAKPTVLATYVRGLKETKDDFDIEWSVMARTNKINDGDAACRLCLKEATAIAFAEKGCINRRTEIANSCRHKRKFLLSYVSAPD